MNTSHVHAFLVIGATAVAGAAHATADFSVDWYSIDAGTSVEATGGTLALDATIGQPDCGATLEGGSFELAGGFLAAWPLDGGSCPSDLTGDQIVDAADLAVLLGAWGACGACNADLTGDGTVNGADLAEVLSSWGPCV